MNELDQLRRKRQGLLEQIAGIDSTMASLKEERSMLRSQEMQVRRQITTLESGPKIDDRWEPMFGAERLTELMSDWIATFNGAHGNGGVSTLSRRTGLSMHSISDIINGKRKYVRSDTLEKLLEAMDAGWMLSQFEPAFPSRQLPEPPKSQYYEE